MLFTFIKNLLFFNCYLFWFASFCLIFWPVPIFLLPNPNRYINFIFNLDLTKDPSGAGALPFFWAFFTLPLGLVIAILTIVIYIVIKKYVF